MQGMVFGKGVAWVLPGWVQWLMSQKAPPGSRVTMSMAWTTLQLQFGNFWGGGVDATYGGLSLTSRPCGVGEVPSGLNHQSPSCCLWSRSTSKDSVQSTGPSPGLHILAWHPGPTVPHHDPPVQL